MLSQTNHWMEIAGTVIDSLLLCRILMLKLQRVYVFITLACLVAVFFDAVQLWLGVGSPEDSRVSLYSRFLYAIIYPLAAWDVFEEAKTEISKLRRLATMRLISGLFFAAIFGFIVSAFQSSNEVEGESVTLVMLALVLWAGASTATLAFLWTLHRQIRKQNIVRPNNTFVWMIFFELTLAAEVLGCLENIAFPLMSSNVQDIVNLLFLTYGIAIGIWCILRLRRVASNVPSAPASANL